MNTRTARSRWTALALTGALAGSLALGVGAPAFAAAPAASPAATGASTALPPLDPAAIRAVLAARPGDVVSGAFVRVTGKAGHFTGTSGDVNPDGEFRIGSISKVFSAAVALQLAAEGTLDLNGTVQHYLPGVLPADYPPITVGELLNHTSGLPGGTVGWGDPSTNWFADHRFDSWTPEQIVGGLAGQPMGFQPGTAQQYNGMNTFLEGLVIEKVTGDSYAHQVQQRIIRPLGLHHTSVPEADDPRLPHPDAHPYLNITEPDGSTGRADVTEQSPWPWAEGGLISSSGDLDRLFTALFGGKLLPPAQQALLFTVPDVPNFNSSHCETGPGSRACMSMGLESIVLHGVTLWGKTGSRPGWTSGVFATRDLSRTLVYSVNPTGINGEETPYMMKLATTAAGLSN
ncbi:serine hydrolase domain-containing protein [Kitasatospora viridis]|uniref:D-alanyl-D-alanine carboxypeptidase n=1 Tax=Kitasatospora viridis TaxID=281105 RepID=A0A561SFB5_9ACTN|nr:serine hydrolase domain-containing protein [Kitasatospora viridis]TWF73561.1 D-alanyl-D-alanine carboxypeptidase [Kitasatospora viridis]